MSEFISDLKYTLLSWWHKDMDTYHWYLYLVKHKVRRFFERFYFWKKDSDLPF